MWQFLTVKMRLLFGLLDLELELAIEPPPQMPVAR